MIDEDGDGRSGRGPLPHAGTLAALLLAFAGAFTVLLQAAAAGCMGSCAPGAEGRAVTIALYGFGALALVLPIIGPLRRRGLLPRVAAVWIFVWLVLLAAIWIIMPRG